MRRLLAALLCLGLAGAAFAQSMSLGGAVTQTSRGQSANAWTHPKNFHQWFWDLCDASSVKQEITGASATTPSVNGDVVGTVANVGVVGSKGGYWVAPTTGQRPILRLSGGRCRLEFDGTDDVLVWSGAAVTLTGGYRAMFVAAERTGATNYNRFFSVAQSGTNDNGNAQNFFVGLDDGTKRVMHERSSGFYGQNGSGIAPKQMIEAYHFADNSRAGLYIDRAEVAFGTPGGTGSLPTSGANEIRLGAGRQSGGNADYCKCDIYSGGLREGDLSSTEITATRAWLARQ